MPVKKFMLQMNILNQPPAKGSGHSVFSGLRGPRPSSHDHHQDACQHLLPGAMPSPPANNTLRSFQPSKSTRTPLIIANRGRSPPGEQPLVHGADAVNPPAVKAQGRQMSSEAVVDSMEDICNLSHLLDLEKEGERRATGSATGDVDFEPRCALGFIRSLMEGTKLRLIKEYYAVGGQLDQKLFPPAEPPPRVITLAVSVSSAVKLERKQMDQIAKKMRRLTGFTNLTLENKVDPSLIAGIVISYGADDAHVIDLSVKGRLAELEARLESSDQSAGADGWNFPNHM